jgi:hypothetical protein
MPIYNWLGTENCQYLLADMKFPATHWVLGSSTIWFDPQYAHLKDELMNNEALSGAFGM